MLLSFQMLPEQPAQELLDAAVLADRLGYHGCYSADEIYHKDAWLLFAALAQRTEQIRLGPCVAPIYMREPTYVAQLAATLDELSDGRAEVVFGIGNIAMLEQYGVQWRGTRPIARLREAHHVMRTFLDEGSIDFAGDFYSYSGVTTMARPVQEHLPLKIGAMGGPKSMELAGEIADGLHTACAYSPQALDYAATAFRTGAERAGRGPAGLDLGDSLLGAIAPDGEAARRAGRILAAVYIPSMPAALLERHGIEPDRVAPISEAFAAGDADWTLERDLADAEGFIESFHVGSWQEHLRQHERLTRAGARGQGARGGRRPAAGPAPGRSRPASHRPTLFGGRGEPHLVWRGRPAPPPSTRRAGVAVTCTPLMPTQPRPAPARPPSPRLPPPVR